MGTSSRVGEDLSARITTLGGRLLAQIGSGLEEANFSHVPFPRPQKWSKMTLWRTKTGPLGDQHYGSSHCGGAAEL